MPRIKKIIVAVEDIQPNSMISEDFKYLKNFICYEEHLKEGFEQFSLRNIWKDRKNVCEKDVETIIANWKNPKKFTTFIGDDIAIFEAKLSDKIKSGDDYIYRVRGENASPLNEIYITYKEVFSALAKKIKSKKVIVNYDGITEKIEYNEDAIANIIARMSEKTNDIYITQVNRDGTDGESVYITVYKNFLKK